jgi:S1-C subfamily serine protease
MPASEGVIARSAYCVPSESPLELTSFAKLRDGEHGLEVADKVPLGPGRIPLSEGDVIIEVQGRATPTLKSFLKLGDAGVGVLPACPGDPVRITVRRAGKRLELRFPMPSDFFRPREDSARRSGFPLVLDADLSLSPDQCGGPVIDRSGRVIGIAVAVREQAGVYVVPASVVREVTEKLMR